MRRALVLLAATLTLAACERLLGIEDATVGTDAMVAPDAGRDAGLDASPDATDSGADAGADAGIDGGAS